MNAAFTTVAFAEGGMSAAFVQLAPLLIIFGIFYFLLIAPARRRQKALQAMIQNLKKGDRVLTTGGVYGQVAAVKEGEILLKIADNVRVRVARSAIAGLEGQEEATSK
ncbi:MAG: preprotein translocase subunit YajC [Thermoanaerobaculia bacterium]|nr:preprotein translocase subunit YajC [Thermoanaerobaculia bacterium]